MVCAHSNQLVGFQALVKSKLGMTMYPSGGPGAKYGQYLKPSMLLSIYARTRSPEAAVKLVDFYVANKEAGMILGVERGVPASSVVRKAVEPTLDELGNAMASYVAFVSDKVSAAPGSAAAGRGRDPDGAAPGQRADRVRPAVGRRRRQAVHGRGRTPSSRAADAWRSPATSQTRAARGSRHRAWEPGRDKAGYLFLLPWLIGFFGLTLGPVLASLYLSFTDFDLLRDPRWIGLDNYVRIATSDPKFAASMRVTFLYVALAVPFKLVFALAVAMLLNRGIARPAALSRDVLSALAARRERRDRGAVAQGLRRRRAGQPVCSRSSASRGRAGSPIPTMRSTRWSRSRCGSSARR